MWSLFWKENLVLLGKKMSVGEEDREIKIWRSIERGPTAVVCPICQLQSILMPFNSNSNWSTVQGVPLKTLQ